MLDIFQCLNILLNKTQLSDKFTATLQIFRSAQRYIYNSSIGELSE